MVYDKEINQTTLRWYFSLETSIVSSFHLFDRDFNTNWTVNIVTEVTEDPSRLAQGEPKIFVIGSESSSSLFDIERSSIEFVY